MRIRLDQTPKLDNVKTTHKQLHIAIALLAAVAFTSTTIARAADSAFARTKLGTIPEFHPELKLGALQGYLDPKAMPDSLALIPPPPEPGAAAFALDVEVAQNTFALRDTPRFALAEADFGYFDENQDGKITRKEFVEKPSAFILRFDRNGDCQVTPEELRAATRPQTDPRAPQERPRDRFH